MPDGINPGEYLSDTTIQNIAFATTGEDQDLYKEGYLLKDGTLIIIEKAKDLAKYLENNRQVGCINNYKGIKIKDLCKATISYQIDDVNKEVFFTASTIEELDEKWSKYKRVKGLPENLICNLEEIALTEEQSNFIFKLEHATNEMLNLLMSTDVSLSSNDLYDMRLTERYSLINFVLTNVSKNLIQFGIANKIHLPNVKRDNTGAPVEIRNYVDANTFGQGE